ncbi:hypothetical protein ABT392_17630 [Paucibacter sp. JuS9]|uniref:hypothetical protein n=1 Tax=Paucibacter sp. JuS9 TaxID=3228748 RepID=UPI003756D186
MYLFVAFACFYSNLLVGWVVQAQLAVDCAQVLGAGDENRMKREGFVRALARGACLKSYGA